MLVVSDRSVFFIEEYYMMMMMLLLLLFDSIPYSLQVMLLLLILTVVTVWNFILRTYKYLHETGVSLIIGVCDSLALHSSSSSLCSHLSA